MGLVRYNSNFNEFFPSTFGNLLEGFFNDKALANGESKVFSPRVDIVETDGSFEIHVAVPGVKKEDFKLDVAKNVLTISGERKLKHEKNENGYRSVETQFGAFSRSFQLPENIDQDNITAHYNDGILEIGLPKTEKKALKTTIKVK